jgi:hypothetical protein
LPYLPYVRAQNHKMEAIDIETELLGDLWVFDLEYRK